MVMQIQAIKNDFSVKVYETHARIALENVRTTIRNYISIKHNTAIRLAIDAMLKTKLTASKQVQSQCGIKLTAERNLNRYDAE